MIIENGDIVYTENTVFLKCLFRDKDGNPIDPNSSSITFYYADGLKSTFLMKLENHVGVGEYEFGYVTPNEETKVIYEWKGDIGGSPSVKRGWFRTKFMK